MSWTRRRLATVATGVVVVAWVGFYAVALATADQRPEPGTAVAQLVLPPLVWVALLQIGSGVELAVRPALRHRRSGAGSGRSAVWLPEALRRHAIDGRTLDGELIAPVGVNLDSALVFCLGIFPLFDLVVAVVGAALGARRATSLELDPVGRPW